nr:ribonuclease H-like domain-containing protein [Tanacetum cinerariifolium]
MLVGNTTNPKQPPNSPAAFYTSHSQGPISQPTTSVRPVGPQSAYSTGPVYWSTILCPAGNTVNPGHAFTAGTLHDPGAWNMDTGASSHLNNLVTSLSENFNTCMYPSISVGDGHSIPVTNTSHSILPTPFKSLHLNNVLLTPHIVKKLIYVRHFVCDNNCTIEFDVLGFSVKDFMTRRLLLRCDSMALEMGQCRGTNTFCSAYSAQYTGPPSYVQQNVTSAPLANTGSIRNTVNPGHAFTAGTLHDLGV